MATVPSPFGRRDVRDEMHAEIMRQQQYEEMQRQRAAEVRAQQAAKMAQEAHQRNEEMFPLQKEAAEVGVQQARQGVRDNQIKLDDTEIMRTATGDISGWLSHQDQTGRAPYARSFYEAPAEARQHFQTAYPTLPASAVASIWNNNVRATTGDAMTGVPRVQSEFPVERTITTDKEGATQVTQAEQAPQVRQIANVPDTAMTKLITTQKAYDKLPALREMYEQVRDSMLTGQGWGAVPIPIKNKIESLFGKKEYKNYQALLNDIVIDVAKGMGGDSGVLTDTDIQRWFDTLPNVNQDPATADYLFNKMEGDMRKAYNRVHDMYGRVYYMGSIPPLSEPTPAAGKTAPRAPVPAQGRSPVPVRPTPPRGAQPAQQGAVQKVDKLDPNLPPGVYEYKGRKYIKE